jgi:hypothetical protein
MITMTLMAEPVPAGDEFAGLDSAETVVAPHSAGADRQSWRATWRQAGLLLMGGLALAGAIILAFWVLTPSTKAVQQQSTALPTPKTPAPSATASAPAAAPPSIASTPDQDTKFVQALNDRGISFANP